MLKRILARILGNSAAQRALQFIAFVAQYFMGIGSGTSVGLSGEAAIFRILTKRNSPPYCVLDVGANQGQFLVMALSSLPNETVVHSFEPASQTFRMLSENIGNDVRVTLNNCGMGRDIGMLDLYFDKAGSGLASLSKRRLDHYNIEFSQSEKIKIDTIDNYCAARNIERINLLKIDVEGHELDVLAGASNMLSRRKVDMVTFEFGGCNIDSRTFFQDFFYLFTNKEMSLYRITPSGYFHPIERYNEIQEQFRTTNYLAVRNDGETPSACLSE
jgi:FkbM family methyltransferase